MRASVIASIGLVFITQAKIVAAQPDFEIFGGDIPKIESSIGSRVFMYYKPTADQYINVYRPKMDLAKGLVVILTDIYLPGTDATTFHNDLAAQLVKDGFAVAYVYGRSPQKDGFRIAAEDIARGIAHIYRETEKARVAGPLSILGFGTGGGFAGLIGTDPTILESAGVPFERLRSIVLINAYALDGPKEVSEGSEYRRKPFLKAFGTSDEAQMQSSAIGHVAAPNAPAFYILTEERPQMIGQSAEDIAAPLEKAGTTVVKARMPLHRAATARTRFGNAKDPEGTALLKFIRERMQ